MDDLQEQQEQAERRGIETAYEDVFGQPRVISPHVLARLIESIPPPDDRHHGILSQTVLARRGERSRIALTPPATLAAGAAIRWEVRGADGIAQGETRSPYIDLPDDLPVGTFELRVSIQTSAGDHNESATLLVAPVRAYQGADPGSRMWALAVQLYAVRSHRNWGHGDFSDLAILVDLAAELGAAGIALNPLHDIYEASPYSPSTRLFLNPLYIDLDVVPEFSGLKDDDMDRDIAALRRQSHVDYPAVRQLKLRSLTLAYGRFRQHPDPIRQSGLDRFRQQRGAVLRRYACFEVLRGRFGAAWWDWPAPWRSPGDVALDEFYTQEAEHAGFFEFAQWIAHEQLERCCGRAREAKLPLGLYLDIAVGVRPDGFDAWSDQAAVMPSLAIGAPPDTLNTIGQNWGLAAFNPTGLEARKFEPFRAMLRAAMQYAGAIRLDHVLGLKRLYLVPSGMSAAEGAYVRLPFAPLLAVIAQESAAHACIVIGEDLGTVPPNFRDTMTEWGIWSYQVMLFERTADGEFLPPDQYRREALASFSTHDLPTFAGWAAAEDLAVKTALGIDPGETAQQRRRTQRALRRVLARHGAKSFGFAAVARFLADAPSRLVLIAIEDALGSKDQVNLPGTTNEYPNWRVRLPVSLEDLRNERTLFDLADGMKAAGRGSARS
jgi:4-alpha-glucanotransferase